MGFRSICMLPVTLMGIPIGYTCVDFFGVRALTPSLDIGEANVILISTAVCELYGSHSKLLRARFHAGRLNPPVAFGNKAMKCEGTEHVLQTVLMAYPDQASSLQGSPSVDWDILAANDLGTGSGWQQSKQN
jgi:hypothetical protein